MELLLNNALFVCGFYFIIIILRKQCEQCLTAKNQLLHCYELIKPITFMLCFKEHQISALSDLKAIYEIQKLFQRIVYMPNLTLVFDLLFSAFCPVTESKTQPQFKVFSHSGKPKFGSPLSCNRRHFTLTTRRHWHGSDNKKEKLHNSSPSPMKYGSALCWQRCSRMHTVVRSELFSSP